MGWRRPRPLRTSSRWLLLICPLLLLSWMAQAQDTGQVCVQSYEDRDADGSRDGGERAIAHGIGAALLDERGYTIASQLLEDSPFAANGLMCFDQLLAGDYRVILTSAEFIATTSASFAASVNPGAAPTLFEFGLRPLREAQTSSGSAAEIAVDAAALDAVMRGLVGSTVMVVIMSALGLLIYLLVYRRRLKRAAMARQPAPMPAPSASAPSIAGLPPQSVASTPSQDPRHKHPPSAGSPLLFADEDTDASPSN